MMHSDPCCRSVRRAVLTSDVRSDVQRDVTKVNIASKIQE